MGLNPGKKARNLVDMGEIPKPFEYTVSPYAREIFDYEISLGDGINLRQWAVGYDNLIVDFAFVQFVDALYESNDTDKNVDVARIDCCHSEVHRHQFYRSNRKQNRYILHPLQGETNHKDAERVVNNCYDECSQTFIDNWETYLERWEDEGDVEPIS